MRLNRIMLMQLPTNCRIQHCRIFCLVPWVATQSSRDRAARRDWLQQRRLVCSLMLMRLQELYKHCASLVGRSVILLNFILFRRKVAKFLDKRVLLIILLQMGEPLKPKLET